MSQESLAQHADTNELLSLRNGEGTEEVFRAWQMPLSCLESLAPKFQRLEQLALRLPPIRIDNALEGYWGDFGTALDFLSTTPVRSLRFLELPIAPIECPSKKTRQAFTVRAQQQARVRLEFLDIFVEVLLQCFPRLRIAALMFGDIISPSTSDSVKPIGYTIT